MKVVIALVLAALACLTFSNAGIVPPNANLQKLLFEQPKPCKCMNGHLCYGEINSDVQCSPSYLFVCCVIPDPQQFDGNSGNDIRAIN